MNLKYKIPFLLFAVISSQLLDAQFNTLMRTKVEKESITSLDLTIQDQKVEKKGRGIKLLSSPSKAELKREIDSLKSSLMKNNAPKSKDNDFDFKRIEDSLILILKANAVLIKKSNSLKTLDFIEDNQQNLTSRVHMPLKSRISVTSFFGSRTHPIFEIEKMHNGADFKAS